MKFATIANIQQKLHNQCGNYALSVQIWPCNLYLCWYFPLILGIDLTVIGFQFVCEILWLWEKMTNFNSDLFIVYYKDHIDGELQSISAAIVSDRTKHDTLSVHKFRSMMIDELRRRNIPLQHIHYISDGAASQLRKWLINHFYQSLFLRTFSTWLCNSSVRL